jgi:hypothetical protein
VDITGVGEVASLAKTVVQTIWPDKSEQEKQQIAAAVALVQGQMDVNKVEAANPSVFVSGWRPAIGWVCATALAYQYLGRPIVTFGLAFTGAVIPAMPALDSTLWELLFGMLGLGGLRTFEKVRGVTR